VIELKVFRQRLRELAYIEGQNITIEPRYWEGKIEVLPNTVAELVGLKCDVIVTTGTEAVLAVKNATKTIPVVMGFSGDAVTLGIIADLARPKKFDLVINLKAAKQIGLTVPPEMLARADRVIK
jgi:ABC-type uncharacterized transport system substrate-binding protein